VHKIAYWQNNYDGFTAENRLDWPKCTVTHLFRQHRSITHPSTGCGRAQPNHSIAEMCHISGIRHILSHSTATSSARVWCTWTNLTGAHVRTKGEGKISFRHRESTQAQRLLKCSVAGRCIQNHCWALLWGCERQGAVMTTCYCLENCNAHWRTAG
jgi:hypothetical protein